MTGNNASNSQAFRHTQSIRRTSGRAAKLPFKYYLNAQFHSSLGEEQLQNFLLFLVEVLGW